MVRFPSNLIFFLLLINSVWAGTDYSLMRFNCKFTLKNFTGSSLESEHTHLDYLNPLLSRPAHWNRPIQKGKTHYLARKKAKEPLLPYEASPGDSVIFPDRSTFKLLGYFGSGGNVDVFRVREKGKDFALRIPNYGESDEGFQFKNNREFINGVETYKKLGIETVDIHRTAEDKSWVLVNVVKNKFELTQILLKSERSVLISQYGNAEVKKAAEGILPLFSSLRKVAVAEDFGTFQVVWDGGKWVVLDPSDPVLVLTDEMLIKHPEMILKSPIHPDMGRQTFQIFMKERLKHLKEDFPIAHDTVTKWLRENKELSQELDVEVDVRSFGAEINSGP